MAEFFTTGLGIAIIIAAQSLLVLGFVMISLLFLVYGDRKIWAAVQMRRGPNVVGIFGLLQSVADALKYVVKEVIIPAGADRAVFILAPLVAFVMSMIAWAVIPFNETWVLAEINVAVLYVFAIGSLEVYGVIMGGWASNSKYAFLGSLRSAAQMISYEVSIGFIIVGVIISTGSLNFGDIVRAQDGDYGIFNWYWLPHFPMVVLFFISALAETNRPPFDLPEAESELVAGYQVEYSSTPFLLFMAGEYIAIFLMCALTSLLFFGGWLSPIPGVADGALWMVAKMSFFFFLFAMVKAITPRYRYDQLMRIGWKVFLPLSLGWVVLVAFFAQFGAFGGAYARWDQLEGASCEVTLTAFGDHVEGYYGAESDEATQWREGETDVRLGTAATLYFIGATALVEYATSESQALPEGPFVLRDDLGPLVSTPAELAPAADFVLQADASISCLREPGAPIVAQGSDITADFDADFDAEFAEPRRAAVRRFATSLTGE